VILGARGNLRDANHLRKPHNPAEDWKSTMQIRERPGARKYIIERGLRPLVVRTKIWNGPGVSPSDGPEFWDGCMAVDATGRESALSTVWRKQMRKMVAEGYWGPIVRRVWAYPQGRRPYPMHTP
jgi:hypothetical protein